MELVILESPFAGDVQTNIQYARECMKDSLLRNEAPMVSHLLYTQCLDDNILEERNLGIEAGLAFKQVVSKTVVYTDLGISRGMEYGIKNAIENGREVEYRSLRIKTTQQHRNPCKCNHTHQSSWQGILHKRNRRKRGSYQVC